MVSKAASSSEPKGYFSVHLEFFFDQVREMCLEYFTPIPCGATDLPISQESRANRSLVFECIFLSKNSKHCDHCLGRLGLIGLPYSPINFLIPPHVTRPGLQPQPPGAASPEAGVRSVRFLRKYSQSYAFYVCFGHSPRL